MGFFDNLGKGMKGFGEGFQNSINENRATGEGFSDHRGTFDEHGARVEGTRKPNLFDLAKGGMTDDKGLFQGGKDDRMFGRYKDFADKVNQGDSGFTLPGGVGPKEPTDFTPSPTNEGIVTTVNKPDGSENIAYDSPRDEANAFAKTFDPENPEDVFKMQSLFGDIGLNDYEGNPINADSQWGYKSQSGLDYLRTGKYGDPSKYGVNPPTTPVTTSEEIVADSVPQFTSNEEDAPGDTFGRLDESGSQSGYEYQNTGFSPFISSPNDSDPFGYGTNNPGPFAPEEGGGGMWENFENMVNSGNYQTPITTTADDSSNATQHGNVNDVPVYKPSGGTYRN